MNFDDIVVKESPGICRCCLSEGCYKDLGTEYTWMNETEVYADMLLDCFDIGITQHNEGPNGSKRLICEVCITRLRDACNFKKQVLDSEKRFIDMLGRGDFRPKVLMYQPQSRLKEESLEESAEDVLNADIEYLEDMDFGADDEEIKTEAHVSLPSTSEASHSRPKRGRPKKEEDRPEKVKKQKVAKDTNPKQKGLPIEHTPRIHIDNHAQLCSLEKQIKSELEETKPASDTIDLREAKKIFRNTIAYIFNNTSVLPFKGYRNRFRCFYCDKDFTSSNNLRKHSAKEHPICNVKLNCMKLKGLGRKFTGIKVDCSSLKCKLCLKTFEDLPPLVDHLKSFHGAQLGKCLDKLHPFKLIDGKYPCPQCDYEASHFGHILIHFNKEHVTNRHLCVNCGASFHSLTMLSCHKKRVHSTTKQFKCTKCSSSFNAHIQLLQHMGSVHKDKVFKCHLCPEKFMNEYLRRVHEFKTHENQQEVGHKCSHCGKTFRTYFSMNKHVRRTHLLEKNIKCAYCDKRFFNKTNLKKHMALHVGERTFCCDYCQKSFYWKKNLTKHMSVHVGDKSVGNKS